jgi:hypothetical protein
MIMPDINQLLTNWGYAGIFVVVILGNIGLPVPEETVLAVAGYLVWSGRIQFRHTLLRTRVAAGDEMGPYPKFRSTTVFVMLLLAGLVVFPAASVRALEISDREGKIAFLRDGAPHVPVARGVDQAGLAEARSRLREASQRLRTPIESGTKDVPDTRRGRLRRWAESRNYPGYEVGCAGPQSLAGKQVARVSL